MQKGLNKTLALTIITVIAGCSAETVDSENIDTQAIWAGIDIVSEDGLSSDINVEFNVGGRNGTNLSLSSGDSVQVNASTGDITLQRDTDFLDVDYEGTIATGASDEQIAVSFNRADGSNHVSSVQLPGVFTISFPQENITFTELRDVDIQWSENGTSSIQITQIAACPDGQGNTITLSDTVSVDDSGNYTSIFLHTLSDTITDEGCDFSIQLSRSNDGTLATGFEEGGYIEARQERKVENMRITR